jgi:hypothetical protein
MLLSRDSCSGPNTNRALAAATSALQDSRQSAQQVPQQFDGTVTPAFSSHYLHTQRLHFTIFL